MKLTIVSKHKEREIDCLIKEARRQKIEVNVLSFDNVNELEKQVNSLGDVILWNSSGLGTRYKRGAFLQAISDKPIINRALLDHPYLPYKLYQQKVVEKYLKEFYIPTYTFQNKADLLSGIQKYKIKFPVVAKPVYGCRGEGVMIFQNLAEIKRAKLENIDSLVWQAFIENKGDFRVFMLGGKPYFAIKRVRQENSWVNNLSRGAGAEVDIDEAVLEKIYFIAGKICSLFGLAYAGVDVIYDSKNKVYKFLEVNTAPDFIISQKLAGKNVAAEVIDLAKALYEQNKDKKYTLVKKYYDKNHKYFFKEQFHYLSRMYLWTRGKKYRQLVDDYRSVYLGDNEDELLQKIKYKYESYPYEVKDSDNVRYQERNKLEKKYPNLFANNAVMFQVMQAESLYDTDIRQQAEKILSSEEILDYHRKLIKTPTDIAKLSTHGINYLYFAHNYFGDNKTKIDLNMLWRLREKYFGKNKMGQDWLMMEMYYLTHIIIGESCFYRHKSRPSKILDKMITRCEEIIDANFFDICLDTKLEFLVCADLLDYKSKIRHLIMAEAKNSFSPIGNYLIDTHNNSVNPLKNDMRISEHRNVLYIMTNEPCRVPNRTAGKRSR